MIEVDYITAGKESFVALLEFVQRHGTRSSEVMKRVLCSCLGRPYFVRIGDFSRFDPQNIQHVLNVIHVASARPGEFEAWALKHFKEEMVAMRSEVEPVLREHAEEFLKLTPLGSPTLR